MAAGEAGGDRTERTSGSVGVAPALKDGILAPQTERVPLTGGPPQFDVTSVHCSELHAGHPATLMAVSTVSGQVLSQFSHWQYPFPSVRCVITDLRASSRITVRDDKRYQVLSNYPSKYDRIMITHLI